ncbi:MAG: hypothetical protein COB53_13280 [Elusimicrobia bacterium]|nr:MAG: hypothetical protein COB53_13280 [Elusimicrobiota bacterium]
MTIRKTTFLLGLMAALLPVQNLSAKLIMSQKAALKLALPDSVKTEKKTAYLSEDEVSVVQNLARAKVDSTIWTYYEGVDKDGKALGYAYFDRVIVRTMPATIMVAISPEGKVRFAEILTFAEPDDYLPHRRWLELFKDRELNNELKLYGAIRNVTNSSLTSEAVTNSVRRLLALHKTILSRSSTPKKVSKMMKKDSKKESRQ